MAEPIRIRTARSVEVRAYLNRPNALDHAADMLIMEDIGVQFEDKLNNGTLSLGDIDTIQLEIYATVTSGQGQPYKHCVPLRISVGKTQPSPSDQILSAAKRLGEEARLHFARFGDPEISLNAELTIYNM